MATSLLQQLWDTTRLRLLVEIGRTGSVTAAARAVGIGQPSASAHLRALEAAAGQQLVERHGRGSSLTDAGRLVAAHAAHALGSMAAADQELAALRGVRTGTLHLGASTVPGVHLLPSTLACFRRDHPGITVEVEIAASRTILERLLAGSITLALVGVEHADERISLEPFLDDEIIGIATPGALPIRNGRLKPDALNGQLLLVREGASGSRTVADASLVDAGIAWSGTWELGAGEAVKRAAQEGLGVAFLSRYAVADEIGRGELEPFRLVGLPPLRRHFSIASLRNRPLALAEREFIGTLTRCCQEHAAFAEACTAPNSATSTASAGDAPL